LKTFPSFGAEVEKILPPYDPAVIWNDIWLPLRHLASQFLKPFYDNPAKRALLKPEAIFEYEGGSRYSAQDIYAANLKRTEWFHALLGVFETYDYIAVPTAQVFPYDKTVHWPREIAGKEMDTYHRWMEVVLHWTLSGSPVVAVPAGFNDRGLPMGLQLVGKPRSDLDLLQFAYAYEACNDWVGAYKPPC